MVIILNRVVMADLIKKLTLKVYTVCSIQARKRINIGLFFGATLKLKLED